MTSFGRSARGWLALAAFLGGLTLPFQNARHFWGTDDPACDPPAVFGTDDGVTLQAATPTSVDPHCIICHWQREAGGASTATSQSAVAWLTLVDSPPLRTLSFAPSVVLSERPSRAPPSVA